MGDDATPCAMGDDATAAEAFFTGANRLTPTDLASRRESIDAFVARVSSLGRRVALVTSGGTTVPLEMNTVRFIDNFSTGTRGAQCAEAMLREGYAVIFLHRKGSNFPFLVEMADEMRNNPLQFKQTGCSHRKPGAETAMFDPRLHSVIFETIFDYLFLLREACCSLATAGRSGMVFLAAAVSDFYVPETQMAEDKIQSHGADGLTVKLKNVPKMLCLVRVWAPEAYVVSFKLETNANILLAKAAGALLKYGVHAVCANRLLTIREQVTIVRRDSVDAPIVIRAGNICGDESDPVQVAGVRTKVVKKGAARALDPLLVKEIASLHAAHVGPKPGEEDATAHSRWSPGDAPASRSSSASQGSCASQLGGGVPAAKRSRTSE